MTTHKEALTLALEALETYKGFIDDAHILEGQWHWIDGLDNVQIAIREALAQSEQEQRCYCGDIYNLGVIHRDDGPCHYPDHKEPEQEPDVYIPADALRQLKGTSLLILRSVPLYGYRGDGLIPLYTTPPQRKPLTEEQIIEATEHIDTSCHGYFVHITRAIEFAHGIKE